VHTGHGMEIVQTLETRLTREKVCVSPARVAGPGRAGGAGARGGGRFFLSIESLVSTVDRPSLMCALVIFLFANIVLNIVSLIHWFRKYASYMAAHVRRLNPLNTPHPVHM